MRRARCAGSLAVGDLVGLGGVIVVVVLFAILLGLVAAQWPPLHGADVRIVDVANDVVSGSPLAVSVLHALTNLGGAEAAWLLLPVTVLWLLVRRSYGLAGYVAATGVGGAVLDPAVKALVGRTRPVVDVAIAQAPGPSFPSGHAMGSTITYGVLLLVFLPVVPRPWRRRLVVAAIALVAVVGATRVALGVHHPSDVLGGWLLGVLWLSVTASAFRSARTADGLRLRPFSGGLAPEERPKLVPAPAGRAVLPDGWHSVSRLVVAAVLLWGALIGAGLLLTEALPAVQRLDAAVVEWFVSIRTSWLSTVAVAVGHLGGTRGIVAALVVAAALALAATRRWRPSFFLVVATVGETALFLGTATIVERARPPVEHLTASLPPTSSFPSGHAAAAVATYGAIALVGRAWSSGWLGYALIALASFASTAVAFSRLYRGVHHPTDVLVSMLYAAIWLAVCWTVLKPGPGPAEDESPPVAGHGPGGTP